jgi:glucose-1-phosphate thymidylyltransferase
VINIRGIILAGGNGTRLYPLTKIINKHLLNVYNKPMIYYPLQTLIDAGITDIMIVAGKGRAGSFLELLGDGSGFEVNLSYMVQEQPKGIAHALGLCEKFVNDENVVVILGDNIYDGKFTFSDFREGARVYLKRVESPERFGVAKFDIKKIVLSDIREKEEWILREIVEKPAIGKIPSNYAVTGLYLYDPNVFDIISCLKPSGRGEMEITDVNNWYIKEGKMDYKIVTGFWSDAGTFESLYNASTFIKNKDKGDV